MRGLAAPAPAIGAKLAAIEGPRAATQQARAAPGVVALRNHLLALRVCFWQRAPISCAVRPDVQYAGLLQSDDVRSGAPMPMADLESVFERLSGFPIRIFGEGELVLAQGSRTGQLLFLLQGAVDVVKDGWHIARIAKPGAVFGDMAVLRDQPHSADVVAIERSSLFVVDDATSFLRTEPLITLYIALVQSGRLDAANRSLIAARSRLDAREQRDAGFVAMLDDIGAALHRAA